MYDVQQARDEALAAIEAMNRALRSNAGAVDIKYLERLIVDRDEMLALAHFNLSMPVLELSAKTGIFWTEIYEIVDKVREKQRKRSPWSSLTDCLMTAPEPDGDPS